MGEERVPRGAPHFSFAEGCSKERVPPTCTPANDTYQCELWWPQAATAQSWAWVPSQRLRLGHCSESTKILDSSQ